MLTEISLSLAKDNAVVAVVAEDREHAVTISRQLERMEIPSEIILPSELPRKIGAREAFCAILTQGACSAIYTADLQDALSRQQPWSDFPLIVLLERGEPVSSCVEALFEVGNVSALEESCHSSVIASQIRRAMRASGRQRQLHDFLNQRKVAHAKLDTLSTLQHLFEQAPGLIAVTLGPEHRFEMANLAYRKLVRSPLIGRTVQQVLPELREQGIIAILAEVYETGKPFVGENFPIVLRRGSGKEEKRFFTFAYQPIIGSEGLVSGIFFEGLETTKQREAQDRIQSLQSKLNDVSRVAGMGEMASTLSHELNQPLMAISNYLRGSMRMLAHATEPPAGDVVYALQQAGKNVLRAGEIIRRARDLVAKGSIRRESVDLATVLHEALDLANVSLGNRGINYEADCAPGIRVLVDPVQIQQVVLNLVRNAVEAMENSPARELKISACRAGNMAEVAVCDRGPGFSLLASAKAFEPFMTSKPEGMGVGLSISRTIIEAHGGTITAEDQQGGGTIVRFSMPLDTRPERSDKCESFEVRE